MFDETTLDLATRVLAHYRAQDLKLGMAESCTGGLISGALTAIAGSSDTFEGGFNTYSNEAKTLMIGVDPALIQRVGAVSEEVARAMAEGVLARLPRVDVAVAVTGVAGPGGGTATKPVGLVHFGLSIRGQATFAWHKIFPGDRHGVRLASVQEALTVLLAGGP
ncbi:MAG TPA: CinA family protein [Stellaceae bacterium]|jgi:nicotinamide-nucleotide amidase|nr:CinA family protein [Stellaceae bacterium]